MKRSLSYVINMIYVISDSVAAIWGLGLAVVAVMMELGQRSRPRLGELGVAQLLPLVEAWIGESDQPPR